MMEDKNAMRAYSNAISTKKEGAVEDRDCKTCIFKHRYYDCLKGDCTYIHVDDAVDMLKNTILCKNCKYRKRDDGRVFCPIVQ